MTAAGNFCSRNARKNALAGIGREVRAGRHPAAAPPPVTTPACGIPGGAASFLHVHDTRLTFVFSKKAIGNPKHAYWWHVRSDYYGPPSECPVGPCEDHAPNGSKTVKHNL